MFADAPTASVMQTRLSAGNPRTRVIAVGVDNACSGGVSIERAADAKIDALFAEWNTPTRPAAASV